MSNNIEQAYVKHLALHKVIVEKMDTVVMLVKQLSNDKYPSFDTYINNLWQVEYQFSEIKPCLSAPFEEYLKSCDPDLYLNIVSVGLAFNLYKNLFINLQAY